MNFKEVISIDISKNTIDVCVHLSQKSTEFTNTSKGVKRFLSWVKRDLKDISEVLFVYGHTGMYSHILTIILQEMNCHYYVAPALDIKRSMGIVRGKDDRIDAKRIALYGYRLREEIIPITVCSKSVEALKSLMTLRSKLVKQRAAHKSTLKEQKSIYKSKDFKFIFETQQRTIHYLTKQIKAIEQQMEELINSQMALKVNMELMLSIKGVGRQMATTMLIVTENFTKFDNSRKFASYCGIAPFAYQSGTSIKGRNRVSPLANKKIKSLIHMCAVSAIQHNPEMRMYYHKRIENGKSKMGTLNIIRNKLIVRIFAVIQRQTPYVDTLKFVA
ncbi:transposase [Jejuia pallidilutea]|uniref:Transposase n=1 Tax=Jejuia pallidilutea TaxID=504487 RepID=A0A362X705_9FLAO|nr:IS110 family transposase [Jejuia pallidilutea]PQV51536.1 transposase [Jejuia pallidilutea]